MKPSNVLLFERAARWLRGKEQAADRVAYKERHGSTVLAVTNAEMVREIAARKRAEDELHQTEAKYRSIFENAVEGIFQTTPDGQYIDVNPALARIYGYESPASLIRGLTDIRGQLYVETSRRDEFARQLQEHSTVSGFESQIYQRDGRVIWIS